MKIRFTPVAAALGFAVGMLVSSGANAADTIKIAVAGQFTGPLTQYGGMVKQGVDTEIEAINAPGGVLGNKLGAVTMDAACEPKKAPAVANRFGHDNIHDFVGSGCLGATIRDCRRGV